MLRNSLILVYCSSGRIQADDIDKLYGIGYGRVRPWLMIGTILVTDGEQDQDTMVQGRDS